MNEALICDAVRTPIGRYGGALSSVRADDLAAVPLEALMERNPGVDWGQVDDVIFGCANQSGEDNRDVARMASLLAGLPVGVGGVTVNRLCGSGLEAVGQAARAIRSDEGQLFLAGGVESMSRAPFVVPKATSAFSRQLELHDTTLGWRFVNPRMEARHGVDSLGITAENVARDYGISREDQDAMAYQSQQRAAAAAKSGRFSIELTPVEIQAGKHRITIDQDEHPRPETTLEQLGRLRPVFIEGGSVTAGNSSGVNDGAAAMIVATEQAARRYNLRPRARILGMATAGVAPRVMGIGPVPAVRKLLARLDMTIADFAVVELNEAFAAQGLAVMKELGLSPDVVNPNGGAIALGHPLGMSGVRLAMTATAELEVKAARFALVTMCIGVGQGVAMVLERVEA